MARRFLLLALAGCTPCANSDSDSDTDTDSNGLPEALACEYGEVAGNWWGDSAIDNGEQVDVQTTATISPAIAEDAVLGVLNYSGLTAGEAYECSEQLICTGRDQNEWRVAKVITADTSPCGAGWAFFKVEQDGTLQLEFGSSEFGDRRTFLVLERAD